MIHYRQRLRDKVVAILKVADIPGINDRVFGSIFFSQRDLPLIAVFVEGETVERSAAAYERRVAINVKVFAKASEGVEDAVDTYCAAIELSLDLKLDGLAHNGTLTDVRFIRDGEGNAEHMAVELVYQFDYSTPLYNPSESIH